MDSCFRRNDEGVMFGRRWEFELPVASTPCGPIAALVSGMPAKLFRTAVCEGRNDEELFFVGGAGW